MPFAVTQGYSTTGLSHYFIFIAGLGNIPTSLQEAASLDGAGTLSKLRHVTIPLMTPLIFYNMVIAIINSFQTFIPAQIITQGGDYVFPVRENQLRLYQNIQQLFALEYPKPGFGKIQMDFLKT